MTWRTHAVVGANAIWLTAVLGIVDARVLYLLPAAALAALLPDLDAVEGNAKIHHLPGPARVLTLFRSSNEGTYLRHRGIMHSLFITALLFAFLLIVSYRSAPLLAPVVTVSYISHIIIDGFNFARVGYLFPFVLKKYSLLPLFLRTENKGLVDNGLFIIGTLSLVLFLFLFAQNFVVTSAEVF